MSRTSTPSITDFTPHLEVDENAPLLQPKNAKAASYMSLAPFANIPNMKRWAWVPLVILTAHAVLPNEGAFNYFLDETAVQSLQDILNSAGLTSRAAIYSIAAAILGPTAVANLIIDLIAVSISGDALYAYNLFIKKWRPEGFNAIQARLYSILLIMLLVTSLPSFVALSLSSGIAAEIVDNKVAIEALSVDLTLMGTLYYALFTIPKLRTHTEALIRNGTWFLKNLVDPHYSMAWDVVSHPQESLKVAARELDPITNVLANTGYRTTVAAYTANLFLTGALGWAAKGPAVTISVATAATCTAIITLMSRYLGPRAAVDAEKYPFYFNGPSDFIKGHLINWKMLSAAPFGVTLAYVLTSVADFSMPVVLMLATLLSLSTLHGGYLQRQKPQKSGDELDVYDDGCTLQELFSELESRVETDVIKRETVASTLFNALANRRKTDRYILGCDALNLGARIIRSIAFVVFVESLNTDIIPDLIGIQPNLSTLQELALALALIFKVGPSDFGTYRSNIINNIAGLVEQFSLAKEPEAPHILGSTTLGLLFTPAAAYDIDMLKRRMVAVFTEPDSANTFKARQGLFKLTGASPLREVVDGRAVNNDVALTAPREGVFASSFVAAFTSKKESDNVGKPVGLQSLA